MSPYKPIAIFICSLSILLSCRPKYNPKPTTTVFNDFESVVGWTGTPSNNSNTVINGEAHSGKFAYKIDKDHSFGYYYKRKFKEISEKKIFWVKISGYCKAKTKSLNKASIVCAIQNEKEEFLLWSEEFLIEYTNGKKDEWVYFEKSFDVSKAMNPEANFSAFVWSAAKEDELLIDDFKIEFFD